VAFKKCKIEKKELTLSYVSTDDVIENLKTLENVKNQIKFSVQTNVKIIDMRREFRAGNYSMLSRYTSKRIKEELEKNNNIALLLNRKPYATFVMCRECGYVLKCPVCNSILYFDIKKGSLYCPVCGYSQKPVEKCPRCGSIAIHYFGGGLQKLEKLLKKEFTTENLTLLTGETKIEIASSRSFKRTIFAGTEYITEHLDFSNISLFIFVSIDTFINSYDFEASFNALRVSSSVIYEMKNNEVIFQTYMPENAQIQAIKSTDHSKFIIDELELRKELGYPPSRNLIVLKIFDNYEKAKDIASSLAKNFENCYILGPTISTSTLSKISYEISIKTEEKLENLFGQVQAIMNKAGVVYKLYVYPAPAIILC
ncbi:MAG: Trm112 family protein, partial [Fervidobacterium sp.]